MMTRTTRLKLAMGAALVTFVAAGCGSSSATGLKATGNIVNASASLVFAPNEIDIAAGQAVTFSFGAVEHTVVFQLGATGAPSNIAATSNANVTLTFNTPGTYSYICSLHNGMNGKVVVGGSSQSTGSGY